MAKTLRELNRDYFFKLDWLREQYKGVPCLKYQTDLDFYEEQIKLRKPDVIIETGTLHGGSALWFQDRIKGQVITIDPTPQHIDFDDRIIYLKEDSGSPDTIKKLKPLIKGKSVMVVLDSNHTKAHVEKEIKLFAPLVTKGQLFVIEDTMYKVYLDNTSPLTNEVYEEGSCSDAVEEWDKQGFELIEHPEITMNPGAWFVRE